MRTRPFEYSLLDLLRRSTLGQSFLTFRKPQDITSLATKHRMKVKTQQAVMVIKGSDRLIDITQVTITQAYVPEIR